MCDIQGAKEIVPDSRISFEQTEDEIILHCRAAEKGDEGNYAVTLKNEKGQDTANINVIVQGKTDSAWPVC